MCKNNKNVKKSSTLKHLPLLGDKITPKLDVLNSKLSRFKPNFLPRLEGFKLKYMLL